MIEDSAASIQKQEEFIGTVCRTEVVWALENSEGFATSASNEYEDEDGNPVRLMCVWADESAAKACVKAEWDDYAPVEIGLADFIESWCIGMYNDGYIIGCNFDEAMFGSEIEPFAMIELLHARLNKLGKQIELENYGSVGELVDEINRLNAE